MKNYDLHERFIDFAVMVVNLFSDVQNSKAGNHLVGKVIRSGTSPSLNYSEAQGAESRNDFIHKMSIVFKELRETYAYLKIIERAGLCLKTHNKISVVLIENNELIAIFVKSIETCKLKIKQ